MNSSQGPKKLTSAAFSDYIKDVHDLYVAALRNQYFLPKESSSAVNELMLHQVLQGVYWCPRYADIKLVPCVKAPVKEVLVAKARALCAARGHNVAWIDDKHQPDKAWLVAVIATLDPADEIFRKDYVAPPVRRRLQDVETIVLPDEIFAGLPKSKSKNKARRLKIVSQAFAVEKATRLREIRRTIDQEILEQEVRVDELRQRQQPKMMPPPSRARDQEEEKRGPATNENRDATNLPTHRQGHSTPRKGVSAFLTPNTSAHSSKNSHLGSQPQGVHFQLSPNTQMKDLTQSLLSADLSAGLLQPPAPATKKK